MARPNNPPKSERLLTQRPNREDDVTARRQPVPFWTEAKGVDRYHESTRVDNQHAVRIRNFMFDDGVLVSRRGTDIMGGEAASTVLQVVDFVRANTKKVTIRFCTRHLEIFEYGTGTWRSFAIPFTGSEKDLFAWTGWADKLIFSNGIDGMWEFDFKKLEPKIIDGAPSAKHLTTFGNRVVASATTEKGSSYPLRIRWSVKNNYLDWTGIGSGFEDFYGSPGGATDEVMGVFPYTDEAAWVVRDRSVWQFSVSGNVQAPFRPSRYLANIGSPFRHSICEIPGGIVFTSRDNIHVLGVGTHQRIGDMIVDEIFEELETLRFSYAAYDVGRQEYRLAGDTLVFRYRFIEEAWTVDEYPFPIKSLSRQIQGKAGIPIDNLPGTIDELEGTIDELVYLRESDDSMMFVPNSTVLVVRETDDDQDTLLTGEKTDSEIEITTGVVNVDPLAAVELHELHVEYISETDQQWLFDFTKDDGASFVPLSVKDIETTQGSEMLFIKNEQVSRKLQIRMRSLGLGKVRILGIAPFIVKVERTMAPKKPRVAGIEILPSPLALIVGGTQQLSIILRAVDGSVVTGKKITLVSTNNSVATVSSTGVVRAISPGSFAIVASVGNIQVSDSGTVSAATPAAVASVTVSPDVSQGAVGTQQQFTATVRDANGVILVGRTVVWSSSTPGFATINSSGLATLVAEGVTAISATVEGVTGGATLTVTASSAVVDHVVVSPATFSGTVGETVQLVAQPMDVDDNILSGKVITWASDATGVATVSATGLVTMVGAGSVTITATCETIDGTSAGTVVAAVVPVSTVIVSPTSFSLVPGQTQALTVTLKDVNGNVLTGRTITYVSSNSAIATVNSSGVVTAITQGLAVITVSSEGKSATASATVTAVPVATVSVSPNSFSVNAGQTQQLVATPRDANGNALTGRVITWGSSDVTKATVSSTGLVTGVAAGSATITATCETKFGTSAATVGAGVYSPVNAPASVQYIPEPNPSGAPSELPRIRINTNFTLSYASTVTLIEQGSITQNTSKLQQYINEAAARAGHSRINIANGVQVNNPITRFHTAGNFYTDICWPNRPVMDDERILPTDAVNAPVFWAPGAGETALRFDRKANNTRFFGIKFKAVNIPSLIYDLVFVSPREGGGVDYDNDITNIPTNIHFIQCVGEGNDSGNGTIGNVRNGITLNARSGALVDSYIHQISAGTESHGVIVHNTPGPIKVVNNYIEGSAICLFFGGVIPRYGATLGRPSDIEIRRNHLTRRLTWAKDSGDWDGVSGRGIKNCFETKNCDRLLFEGNVCESNWADSQTGMAVVIKSGTGDGISAAGCGSENVTVRHNLVRNSVRCWNVAALPDEQDAIPAKKITLHNNLAYNIGSFAGQSPPALAWLFNNKIDDLFVDHNTTIPNIPTTNTLQFANVFNGQSARFVFKNNLTAFNYVWSEGILGTSGIANFAAAGYSWVNNVVVMDPANWAIHPQGTNQYDDLVADIGFVDLPNNDYTLAGSSPYKGDGEGGSDPGADIAKVILATDGVVVGSQPCLLITNSNPLPISPLTRPVYLGSATDPDLGTELIRVTGDPGVAIPTAGSVWPTECGHQYSKVQAWSKNMTYLFLNRDITADFGGLAGLLIDGNTYAPIVRRNHPGTDARWHPGNDALMLCVMSDGSVKSWNPVTDAQVTLYSASGYSDASMGNFEGNPDVTGQYVVVTATRTSDSHLVAYVVDTVGGTKSADIDLTAASVTSLDWASISQGAGYVVIYGTISAVSQAVNIYDRATLTLQSSWTTDPLGHFDLGINPSGQEVAFGACSGGSHAKKFIARRLDTGAILDLSPAVSFDWHASCRNHAKPGWGYAVTNDQTGSYLDETIYAIKLDGTQIQRLARHRSNAVGGGYWHAPHASPSPDGKRVIFRSDWKAASPLSAFVLDTRDICP